MSRDRIAHRLNWCNMSRLHTIALIFFLTCAGWRVGIATVPVPVEAAQSQQDPAKITVYITKTGQKYHRDGCSSLRKSRFAVSLKEAVARGFGPCKNCRPPTIARPKNDAGNDQQLRRTR